MNALDEGLLRRSHRATAILRAIAAGRADMTCGIEPDLFIDGLACCDQLTARQLSHLGLIRPACPGSFGQRVPAHITPAGHQLILSHQAA